MSNKWATSDGSLSVEAVRLAMTSKAAGNTYSPNPTHDGEWFLVKGLPRGFVVGWYDSVEALAEVVPLTSLVEVAA